MCLFINRWRLVGAWGMRLVRSIWTAREKAIHESIFQTPFATHKFVNGYISELDDLKKFKLIKPSVHAAPEDNTPVWEFPRAVYVKIDMDGGISRSGTTGVAAALCRDDQGLYLGASALVLPGVIDPL